MTRRLLVAIVAASAWACSGPSQIVSPTPTTTTSTPSANPTSSSIDAARWDVRIETTAVTGPPFCIFLPSVGAVFRANYEVSTGSGSVFIVGPECIDWDCFTAPLSGANFAVTTQSFSSNGMCAAYVQESSISGNFAPDHNSFVATVTWSFTLAAGGVKTVTFSWTGTRNTPS